MHDEAHDWTDEQIKDLDRRIHSIYSEASRDIDKKLEDFRERYKVKESIHLQQVKDGKWTQEKFDNWVRGQVFQEKQWEAKRDQIIKTITDSNKVASGVINDNMSNVFGYNATYMNYTLEHGAGIDMGFGIYDQNTVAKLIKDNPQALPRYKINEQKDYIWNKKLVNNAITQGIIQGESIDKISKRITDSLCMQNENLSRTFARTAMTEAQNAGRLQSLEDAEEMGIEVHKMWMATLDGRTRDSHRELDGESVPTDEKFSNGLMYPADPSGDPSEVYNCRCTMVGDVKKYPAKFQRRNQEKDKPIQYMSYKQWAKLKEAGKKGYVASEGGKGKTVDYSKYGGEESFEIMKKYGNYDDFINNSSSEEFNQVWEKLGSTNNIKEVYKNAGDDFKIKTKDESTKETKNETELIEKQIEDYKSKIKDYEYKIDDVKNELEKMDDEYGEFSGIWYKDVTLSDYEEKKPSIPSKYEWYDNKLEELNNIENPTDAELEKIDKIEDLKDLLKEYEELGEKYLEKQGEMTDFQKEMTSLQKELKDLNKQLNPKSDDTYSQERKDEAIWAKSGKEADSVLREKCGKVWRNASKAEREAIYDYTVSFSKFNEPLRGWEYGQTDYHTGAGFKGVGNTDLNAGRVNNGQRLNDMTAMIERSSYDEDIWLQRGCNWGGMDSFFGVDMELLKHGTQEELEAALLGTTPTEYGFMSCGSSKGQGFSDKPIILNVYTPSGTKMMYVEPFSAFGDGDGKRWDGVSKQSSFGGELETILQQNTQFEVTKVERDNGKLFVDLDVIAQNEPQLWKK